MPSQLTEEQYKQKYPQFADKMQFDAKCVNAHKFYYFLDDFVNSYKINCPFCNKPSYAVTCKKCNSGFFFTEKQMGVRGDWKCDTCSEVNTLDPYVKELPGFKKEQIPLEVLNYVSPQTAKANKINKVVFNVSLVVIGLIFFVRIFVGEGPASVVGLLLVAILLLAMAVGFIIAVVKRIVSKETN